MRAALAKLALARKIGAFRSWVRVCMAYAARWALRRDVQISLVVFVMLCVITFGR